MINQQQYIDQGEVDGIPSYLIPTVFEGVIFKSGVSLQDGIPCLITKENLYELAASSIGKAIVMYEHPISKKESQAPVVDETNINEVMVGVITNARVEGDELIATYSVSDVRGKKLVREKKLLPSIGYHYSQRESIDPVYMGCSYGELYLIGGLVFNHIALVETPNIDGVYAIPLNSRNNSFNFNKTMNPKNPNYGQGGMITTYPQQYQQQNHQSHAVNMLNPEHFIPGFNPYMSPNYFMGGYPFHSMGQMNPMMNSIQNPNNEEKEGKDESKIENSLGEILSAISRLEKRIEALEIELSIEKEEVEEEGTAENSEEEDKEEEKKEEKFDKNKHSKNSGKRRIADLSSKVASIFKNKETEPMSPEAQKLALQILGR